MHAEGFDVAPILSRYADRVGTGTEQPVIEDRAPATEERRRLVGIRGGDVGALGAAGDGTAPLPIDHQPDGADRSPGFIEGPAADDANAGDDLLLFRALKGACHLGKVPGGGYARSPSKPGGKGREEGSEEGAEGRNLCDRCCFRQPQRLRTLKPAEAGIDPFLLLRGFVPHENAVDRKFLALERRCSL